MIWCFTVEHDLIGRSEKRSIRMTEPIIQSMQPISLINTIKELNLEKKIQPGNSINGTK